MENFSERFSFLMDNVLQTSGSKMGRDLNVNISSILRYKNGQASPSVDFIEKVCGYYGISANWLVMGIGPTKIVNLVANGHDETLSVGKIKKSTAMIEDLNRIQRMIDDIKQKHYIL